MKKITLLAAVLVAVSFASCKKEKTCSCTVTETNTNSFIGNPTNTYSYETKFAKIKKGDANLVCPTSHVETDNNNASGSAANINTKTTSCTIK